MAKILMVPFFDERRASKGVGRGLAVAGGTQAVAGRWKVEDGGERGLWTDSGWLALDPGSGQIKQSNVGTTN